MKVNDIGPTTHGLQYNNSNMTISNSISIRGGLKSFMLKNCKVDLLGNSKVAFHFRVAGGGMQSLSAL
jgi:hypothetical protein